MMILKTEVINDMVEAHPKNILQEKNIENILVLKLTLKFLGDKMDIWKSEKWQSFYAQKQCNSGIHIRFEKGVDKNVKSAIIKITSWLRKNYKFPKRVQVYIKKSTKVRARDGDLVCDLFFGPYNRDDEPYITIATGDYQDLIKYLERDDALATILIAFLKDITFYYQWLNDIKLSPSYEKRQARKYARMKLNEYAETTPHP